MTESSGEPEFEFDAAVSFAGEDREFVEEVVDRLKAQSVRVFYDTDYQAAMWGEDLVEYLDEVYRRKARYPLIFISRSYAAKAWTRHERRSALARAMDQRAAYVLPVRLDDTILDGLRPTVTYLDARDRCCRNCKRRSRQAYQLSLRAPCGHYPAPRIEVERQQILIDRPQAWEHLYFAAQLLHELKNAEPKYNDHEIGYAALGSENRWPGKCRRFYPPES